MQNIGFIRACTVLSLVLLNTQLAMAEEESAKAPIPAHDQLAAKSQAINPESVAALVNGESIKVEGVWDVDTGESTS